MSRIMIDTLWYPASRQYPRYNPVNQRIYSIFMRSDRVIDYITTYYNVSYDIPW